ncbi:MAG: endonuclease/exonuclease/phosphatase family protein [Alphaproteobacteria bacterium]
MLLTKKNVYETVRSLTVILTVTFIATFAARLHWIFDLFSHFPVYHVIGGIALAPALFYFKKNKWALCTLLVAVLSMVKICNYFYTHGTPVLSEKSGGEALTVVQYNRLAIPRNHDNFKQWITDNEAKFDVIVLQEANSGLANAASELGHLYPFQIQEPRLHAFGMVILSKYPISDVEKIKTAGSFAAKFTIDYNKIPVRIYALHAQVPILDIRNIELEMVTGLIAQDKSENIIFMGDWNITPYSPHFDDILKTTGLQDNYIGYWPPSTWPSFIPINFLRLPIDHILYKGNLHLLEKEIGPAMGSDHHAVIATFRVPG